MYCFELQHCLQFLAILLILIISLTVLSTSPVGLPAVPWAGRLVGPIPPRAHNPSPRVGHNPLPVPPTFLYSRELEPSNPSHSVPARPSRRRGRQRAGAGGAGGSCVCASESPRSCARLPASKPARAARVALAARAAAACALPPQSPSFSVFSPPAAPARLPVGLRWRRERPQRMRARASDSPTVLVSPQLRPRTRP